MTAGIQSKWAVRQRDDKEERTKTRGDKRVRAQDGQRTRRVPLRRKLQAQSNGTRAGGHDSRATPEARPPQRGRE